MNKKEQRDNEQTRYQARYIEESLEARESEYVMPQQHTTDRTQYAKETLGRYSGIDIDKIQPYVLLTNFPIYVEAFAQVFNVDKHDGPVLNTAHYPKEKISIIDYQLGAPMAALIIDILSYTNPQCVVMLGLCGGLHRYHRIGDFLLPVAAIRDEGASRHYMPLQVPSLPAFLIQQFISEELMSKQIAFKTGVIHTTDYRMWEFDTDFKKRLKDEKATAIDMECSALFTAGFRQKVPVGSLMIVSDLPLKAEGIKTKALSDKVFSEYRDLHLQCGIQSLQRMRKARETEKINFRRFHF